MFSTQQAAGSEGAMMAVPGRSRQAFLQTGLLSSVLTVGVACVDQTLLGAARTHTMIAQTVRNFAHTSREAWRRDPWDFKPMLLDHPAIAYKLLVRECELLREAEKRPPV
jgi:hypothetical protein